MRQLWQWKALKNQLRYQIIVPFLLLTVSVTVIGSLAIFSLLGRSMNERFDRRLADATRGISNTIVEQEQANLAFLYSIAFAQANPLADDAPAVDQAVADRDREGLTRAVEVFYRDSKLRPDVNLDRLIVFDRDGFTLVDLEQRPNAPSDTLIRHEPLDLSNTPFVQQILSAEGDPLGDKYAGVITFAGENGTTSYFATIAPIRLEATIVGGVIAATQLDTMMRSFVRETDSEENRLAGVILHDQQGQIVSTSFPRDAVSAMSPTLLSLFTANPNPFNDPLLNRQTIADQDVQFAFVPMLIRGVSVGILAAALPTDLIFASPDSIFWVVLVLIITIAVVVFAAGIVISGRIIRPIEELVQTSIEVSAGNLDRRAQIQTENEIGQLAVRFNQMTGYLVQINAQVQVEANQRSAIVNSIADGIVVVDDLGYVQLINRAARRLMNLDEAAALPTRLSDIPMQKLTEGVPGFGTQRAQDLYTLGEYIVRVSVSPVESQDQTHSGYVCVLQDMTKEVAVDRAKTNFIGTISHELRTPLTVITGNTDLLLRGLAGRLEDEQATFVETIRQHAGNMAGLLNNVIMIANFDSGVDTTEMGELELARPIDEAYWRVQSQVKAKGLGLSVQVPKDLRPAFGDFDHVRQIVHQLLDNARRYTTEGSITVRALDQGDHVCVEVEDTGRGVAPDMYEQIFQRFSRGDGTSEGINSAERGIGLGLAICKHLVERQGGTIGVRSVLGQGSTFYFTLRYAHDTPSPEKTSQLVAAD